MAQNDDVAGSPGPDATPAQPAADEPATVSQPVTAGPTAGPVLKTRWRDRVWSFRAMLAVALATLVIGGVGGLVVGAAAARHHDRHDGFYDRMGPGGPGMMGPGWRMRGGPGWHGYDGQPYGQPYGGPASSLPAPANPASPTPSAPGSTG